MEWKRELEKLHVAGHHAFLLIGPADGFPMPLSSAAPADALFPWEECLMPPKGALAWSFDQAHGFRFKDEKERSRFVSFLRSGVPTDPVSQASQQVQELTLPTNPLEAMRLMQAVLERAANTVPPLRCSVMLPDVDAYAPANGDANSRIAAVLLRAMAQNDTFRRAGHTFTLSAPAMAALDERLRRPDAPFTAVRLQRPTQEERFAFLRRICTPGAALGQAVKLRADREAVVAERRAELARDLRALENELSQHVAYEALAVTGKTAEALMREEREASEAFARAAAQAPDIVKRQEKLREINVQLAQHPERPMTVELWKGLVEGDAVRFEGGTIDVTKIVLTRQQPFPFREDRAYILSKSASDRSPHVSSDGRQLHFVLTDEGLCTVVADRRERWTELGGHALHFLSKERLSLLARRCEWTDHLEKAIGRSEEVRAAKERLDAVQEKFAAHQAERRLAWQARKRELETKLEETRLAHDDPDSTRLRELDKLIGFVDTLIGEGSAKGLYAVGTENLGEIARMSQGFGYRDLAMLVREAVVSEGLVPSAVTSRRIDILNRSYGHLFEIVDPAYGFEGVAGYEGVKAFLLETRDAMRGGAVEEVSLGCLLLGPPGTGKTALAEAFARECGFLFVKLRNLRTMWVGESERQIEEVHHALRDLAPCVVLRDEVDEEDSGRDTHQGDSGVSARMRRAWMVFLSDPKIRGRVFVMSITNRPDRLDAALKRSGRNDTRIPCLMPDADMRAEIFRVMLRRGGHATDITDFAPFAAKTEGLSGADIEVIVRRAAGFARRGAKQAIDAASLDAAIDDFIPSASQVTVASMSLMAIKETSFKEFLPKNVDELVTQYLERIPTQQVGLARLVLVEQDEAGQGPPKGKPGKAN